MIRFVLAVFLTCACYTSQAQVNIITTIAGTRTAGYSGDGGPATNAQLKAPYRVCCRKSESIYFSDALNHRIRKIDLSTGVITTIAGNGIGGYNGDGIAATTAQLFIPQGLALDTNGNIYVGDALNYRVRKIDIATGIITTVAGKGIQGQNGDGGLGVNAELDGIVGINLDKQGNLYIVDYTNNKVRKVNSSNGLISTVAGSGIAGYSGDGGDALSAKLNGVIDVYVNNTGDMIISDKLNNVLRKVAVASGVISTIAGTGANGFAGDGGSAIHATFNQQSGIYVDVGNNIFVADYQNGSIRKISGSTGIITTVAGIGVTGFAGDEGPATNAKLFPTGTCVDSYGNLIIADNENNRIRKVSSGVAVTDIDKAVEAKLFPNPTTGVFSVQVPVGISLLTIYNIGGVEVLSQTITTGTTEVDLSGFPSGIYLVYVRSGDKLYVNKVMKQ
ncbi:MAG: T9SS type A sorting domain-containing protein [Chitinophagaceae bacterium]|nr:T9SS type A sorting domain-containing protein [Chitinophagaceae bacterium]